MGILQLNNSNRTHQPSSVNEGFLESQFARSQIESLEKYENYLLSIARTEMRCRLIRKFGVSDVVQQTFQQAVGNVTSFNGNSEEQFRAWLRKILINQMRQNERELYRAKRNINRERSLDQEATLTGPTEPTDRWPTPSTVAIDVEEDRRLHRCLSNLPDHYRQVVELRNWNRLSFVEIGKRMNQSTDAVKKLWYRSIIRLQKEMEAADPQDDKS